MAAPGGKADQKPLKGHGALSNPAGRFERRRLEAVDGLRDSTTAEFRSVRTEMASEFKSVRSEISTLKIMIILVAVEVLATGWPRLYQDISGIPWHLK